MKFNRYAVIAASALALTACESDPLNVDPTASIPVEQALRNASEINLALRGAYDALQSSRTGGTDGTYSRNLIAFPDLYADNLRFTGTFTTDQEVGLRDVRPTNGAVAGIWAAQYEVINRANNVLGGIGNASDLTTAAAADVRGQALFLRGLAYFNLVRWFGGVPIVTSPTQEITPESQQPRSTAAQVYEQIEKDLNEAATLLAVSSTPARATRGAATALLAKVHLEQAEWAQARDRATAVIASRRYSLADSYGELFGVKNSSESIFEVQYTTGDRNSLAFWFYPRALGGRYGFAPTPSLAAAYPAGDARRDVSMAQRGTQLYGRKYTRISNGDDNVIVLRLADMYLTRAEANARLGGPANLLAAVQDVNLVRQRAGLVPLPLTTITQQQVLDAILDERRRELAFEGHRFFDLRRFGRATSVLGIAQQRLLFPIPQRELDVNSKLEQNPGY